MWYTIAMITKTDLVQDITFDNETCGVTKTIKVIGAKWTTLILRDLFEGTKRFGELQRSLSGISSKTLSVRLQELEADGIINKHVFAEVPPHVSLSKVISCTKSVFVIMAIVYHTLLFVTTLLYKA